MKYRRTYVLNKYHEYVITQKNKGSPVYTPLNNRINKSKNRNER